MYFDPLSTWLVVLIANGINLASEKCGGNVAQTVYEHECATKVNEWLNKELRWIKKKHGVRNANWAFDEVHQCITRASKSYPFNCSRGEIIIELDNQDYLIELLEECAKQYTNRRIKFYLSEEGKDAEWYKNAAIEARRLRTKYLHETRLKEEQQKKNEAIGCGFLIVLSFAFIVLLVYFFS